jgi:hypothetical protein
MSCHLLTKSKNWKKDIDGSARHTGGFVLDWFSEFGRLTGGWVSGGVKHILWPKLTPGNMHTALCITFASLSNVMDRDKCVWKPECLDKANEVCRTPAPKCTAHVMTVRQPQSHQVRPASEDATSYQWKWHLSGCGQLQPNLLSWKFVNVKWNNVVQSNVNWGLPTLVWHSWVCKISDSKSR